MDEDTALLPPEATSEAEEAFQAASKTQKYPAPFYDPTTHKLLKDPVVAPGGITYERSTWEVIVQEQANTPAPAYDNRALQQIIQETLIENNGLSGSGRNLLLKVHHSMRKSLTELAEKSVLPNDDHKALNPAYYCPITASLMRYPVIAPGGFTYEKDAIETWIAGHQVSPLTREPLPSRKLLYPNLALKELLVLEATQVSESELHSSIRNYRRSFLDNKDGQQGEEEAYTGPRTMDEWEEAYNDNDTDRGRRPLSHDELDAIESYQHSGRYSGPLTNAEWDALTQQRRRSNMHNSPEGWANLGYLVFLLLVFIALGFFVGWFIAIVFLYEAISDTLAPGRGVCELCPQGC